MWNKKIIAHNNKEPLIYKGSNRIVINTANLSKRIKTGSIPVISFFLYREPWSKSIWFAVFLCNDFAYNKRPHQSMWSFCVSRYRKPERHQVSVSGQPAQRLVVASQAFAAGEPPVHLAGRRKRCCEDTSA